jgi:hypothetical protein
LIFTAVASLAAAQAPGPGVDYARRILRQSTVSGEGLDWSLPVRYDRVSTGEVFFVGPWRFRTQEAQGYFLMSRPRDHTFATPAQNPVRTESEARAIARQVGRQFGWREDVDFNLHVESSATRLWASLSLPDKDGFWRLDPRATFEWDLPSGHLRSMEIREVTRFQYHRPLFYLSVDMAATLARIEFDRQHQLRGGAPVPSAEHLAKNARKLWVRPSTDLARIQTSVARAQGYRLPKAPVYSFTHDQRAVSIHAGTGEVLEMSSRQADGTWESHGKGALNPPRLLASLAATLIAAGAGLFWWARRRRQKARANS